MAATMIDPYATLGIPVDASRDEAARAHRRLAKQFHPDVNPGPAAAERMRRINAAWRILEEMPSRARSRFERGQRGILARPRPADGHRDVDDLAGIARFCDATHSPPTAPGSRRTLVR